MRHAETVQRKTTLPCPEKKEKIFPPPKKRKRRESHAPASENEDGIFPKVPKPCACNMNVLRFIGGKVKCSFFGVNVGQKQFLPSRNARLHIETWRFERQRDAGFAGIIIFDYIYMCVCETRFMCIYIYIHSMVHCLHHLNTDVSPKMNRPNTNPRFRLRCSKKTREKGLFQQEVGMSLMKKNCQPTNLRIVISG